ncbi:hypothetical protein KAT60_01325 [Candidatus Woesebacteria bacterium]|nr:hypothetical protein [Candidatus Woesebacteria bacterium]
MRKEQLFGAVAISSLFLTSCEVFSPKGPTPTEDLVQPQTSTFTFEPETQETSPEPETQETSLPFTQTLSPTSTLAIEEGGYLSGALICPVESREFDLPEVGEVVEFQGMDWKVVGVDEFNSDRCENGIQIVLQLCPCEEGKTPTATATFFESSSTPAEKKKTPFPPTLTPSPQPPTEIPTSTPKPTPTPVPTATIPSTITPQPSESTSTPSS